MFSLFFHQFLNFRTKPFSLIRSQKLLIVSEIGLATHLVFTFKINYILLVYIFQAFFIVYFKEQEIIQKDRKNSTRMITIPVYWKQPEEKP